MTDADTISLSLREIADHIGAELVGDGSVIIDAVSSMDAASPGSITYIKERSYLDHLADTQAAAVILKQEFADQCSVPVLIVKDPYVAYARVAQLFHPLRPVQPGIHASAQVSQDAFVAESSQVDALVVIDEDVRIGDDCYIGPGCVLRRGVQIGNGTRLMANVTINEACVIGQRGQLHAGIVIGADGFGFANDGGEWIKIPQIGKVVIGDDVEIGANTCIDCGTVHDTVIGNGVKIDNLVQIGHNVVIGDHSIIVSNAGLAGSSLVGKHCAIAGGAGLAGHLELCDGVTVTGMTMVTHSITEPGVYSSGISAQDAKQWRRNHARLQQLDKTIKELSNELRSIKKQLDKG
jgi:UDP-3-O-[3-hydroxymyristoyl] glucosamine N-acyltransferase